MIIDGRAIAETLKEEVKEQVVRCATPPRLSIIACQPTFETKTFITKKTAMAEAVGITVVQYDMSPTATLSDVEVLIQSCAMMSDGIIVQLPFPHLPSEQLLALIPATHDVDVSRYDGTSTHLLPPVVGAINSISDKHHVVWEGQKVVVVGYGRLVGRPVAAYATARGAAVTVVTADTPNYDAIHEADIVILGAGTPGILTPNMIKNGVVVFDAGTSEEGGVLRGDADRAVADKASLFTPVPGGIGPITIAVLLQNVVTLAEAKNVRG